MIKKVFTYSFSLLAINTFLSLNAQDFHYSMNQLSPLNLNPALTGWYNGDVRINTNHRTQWASVSTPFTTYSISSDFTNEKSIPFGIQINQDRAGDSRFNTLQVNFSSSFNLLKDTLQQLRVGFQAGFTSRSISDDNLSFDAQYNGTYYDPNLSTLENFNTFKKRYGNINLGLLYLRKINEKHYLSFQLSTFNLNSSDQSFMGAAPPIAIDIKLISKLEHNLKINNFFEIKTSIFYINQGPHKEVLLGSEFHYTLAELSTLKRALWAGIYYRNNDALFLTTGLTYDSWKIGIAYDINLSELIPASRRRGGFEIAAVYILKRKIKLSSPILICPDYL